MDIKRESLFLCETGCMKRNIYTIMIVCACESSDVESRIFFSTGLPLRDAFDIHPGDNPGTIQWFL